MRITWSEPALRDLVAIHAALARDSEPFASRVLERLLEAPERAGPMPRLGRVVQEMGDELVREVLFQSYRIIYQAEAQGIVVLAVLHGGRAAERREPRRWELF